MHCMCSILCWSIQLFMWNYCESFNLQLVQTLPLLHVNKYCDYFERPDYFKYFELMYACQCICIHMYAYIKICCTHYIDMLTCCKRRQVSHGQGGNKSIGTNTNIVKMYKAIGVLEFQCLMHLE